MVPATFFMALIWAAPSHLTLDGQGARCEQIEREGGSAFKEHLLPSAALTLRQGFGRLVRTRSDRGLVAILDGRMRSKGYGKLLLRALPDARRLEARADALAFLHAVRDGGSAP